MPSSIGLSQSRAVYCPYLSVPLTSSASTTRANTAIVKCFSFPPVRTGQRFVAIRLLRVKSDFADVPAALIAPLTPLMYEDVSPDVLVVLLIPVAKVGDL